MDKDITVLLTDEDSAGIEPIRRVLGDQANRFKLRRVADVSTALARIRGGGIDLALLTLPAGANPVEIGGCVENPLAPFLELQQKYGISTWEVLATVTAYCLNGLIGDAFGEPSRPVADTRQQ